MLTEPPGFRLQGMSLQAIHRHTFLTSKVFARPKFHCKMIVNGRRLIDRIPTSGRLDAGA